MRISLFQFNWQQYLRLLFLLFAVGFVASGSVTWVAANWDSFNKFEKLYATQALLSLSFVLLTWRLRKSVGFSHYAFAFLSAVLIGALLALIGQIYQTGADTWELFAWWCLLQLPLLCILPNIANALLFIATANIATFLLLDAHFYFVFDAPYYLMGLNLCFVLVSEFFHRTFHDQQWRILPKISNLLFLLNVFMQYGLEYNALIVLFISLVGLFLYKQRKEDIFCLALYFSSTILAVNMALLTYGKDSDESLILMMFVLTISAFIGGMIYLKKIFAEKYPRLEFNWVIQLMMLFFACLVGLLLIGVLVFVFNIPEESSLLFTAILLLFASIIAKAKQIAPFIIQMLLAMGGMVSMVYFFASGDDQEIYMLCLMLIYCAVIFFITEAHWVRILAVLLVLTTICWQQQDFILQYTGIFYSLLMLLTAALLLGLSQLKQEKWLNILKPIAWAGIISVFALPFFDVTDWQLTLFDTALESLSPTFFAQVTQDFFSPPWSLTKILFMAVCCLPLVIFLYFNKSQETSLKSTALITLVLLFMAVSFISNPVILFIFGLLLLAHINHSYLLFSLTIIMMLDNLGQYYYNLNLPLLYKSFLLLGVGVIFSLVSVWLWYENKPRQTSPAFSDTNTEQSAVKNSPVFSLKMGANLVILVTVLTGANYLIQQNEDVLNNGEPIILPLAPVDPRSLMQGDYMALNYQLLEEIPSLNRLQEQNEASLDQQNDPLKPHKLYVLLEINAQHIAHFCAVETEIPTEFKHCTKGVYLPIKVTKYDGYKLPTHSYFFAEGKDQYYAHAKYGEYRFKQGKALLLRLLDEDLHAL
ncbi:GDYXXLXY domain-containing protein [Lonepinella sp. MS14435]|uniref:GDYXXLXY domain-containing protein n=1 Tax=Lonepinella sp. MS14435 TaxID=3003618 RepID=UPI0036DF64B8